MTYTGFHIATLVLSSVSVIAAAQAPQGGAQRRNPASHDYQAPATSAQKTAATLTGCLYREEQIPGRKPNVAEKAGVLEDYILADVSAEGSHRRISTASDGDIWHAWQDVQGRRAL